MCSLSGGILLLDFAVGGDQVEGLSLGLEDGIAVATKDNNNVEILEAVMSLLEGDLGANNDTSTGENLRLSGGNGDIEGLGSCWEEQSLVCSFSSRLE